ncbi:MAG: hypothetical protein ACO1OG_11750 [Devosia sp.]
MEALAELPFAAEPAIGADNRVTALATALAAPREAIDDAFVGVGGRLSECAALLGGLTECFEALPTMLRGQALSEATDRLAVVGQRAEEISAALGTEQQDVVRLVSVVASAGRPIEDLRRTVKMMGIVAVNARVVAAGIAAEMDDFDVFTTDIAQLSDSAAKTIATFHRTYAELTSAVQEAAEARGKFEAAHAGTLARLAGELGAGLAELADHRNRSIAASAETGRVSRAISDRVGMAVMSLQVGDSTRQRLEHVEAALTDLATTDPALIAPVAELQRQQLADARETLAAEMASGETALMQLAGDAMAIVAQVGDVHGTDTEGSGLAKLHAAVVAAVAVLRDCEAEREKLDTVANAVATTVRVLLDHVEAVQDIESKMRLVSLNAAVRCAQLGPRGRALDVISQQLRALTSETVVSANDAVARLNEAAEVASVFTAAAAGATAGRVGDLEREATASLKLLDAIASQMELALAALRRDAPLVARHLGEAVDDMSRHDAISEAVSDVELGLAALAGGQSLAPEPAADLLATLRPRYTMGAERRIHDAFTGVAAPQVDAPTDGGDALDELFF